VAPPSGPSFTVVLPSGVLAGDALVLSVAQPCLRGTTAVDSHVTAVSGASVTWLRAAGTTCGADGAAELWYGLRSPGSPAGTTVTVSLHTSATVSYAEVAEYAGVTGLDTTAGSSSGAQGSSIPVGPGAATPGSAGELLVSGAYVARAVPLSLVGLLGSFVPLSTVSPFHGMAAWVVDDTRAAQGLTYTQMVGGTPVSGPWSAATATFTLGG